MIYHLLYRNCIKKYNLVAERQVNRVARSPFNCAKYLILSADTAAGHSPGATGGTGKGGLSSDATGLLTAAPDAAENPSRRLPAAAGSGGPAEGLREEAGARARGRQRLPALPASPDTHRMCQNPKYLF